MTKPCTMPGCDNTHYARGWCWSHYTRNRRYGSPEVRAPKPRIMAPKTEAVQQSLPESLNRRVRFSPNIWDAWWAKNQRDEHTEKLAKGIAEFRELLQVGSK